jgi:hypothetical protein
VVPFCDRNCNVISPFVSAPGNRNETKLLAPAIINLRKISKNIGLELKGVLCGKVRNFPGQVVMP